MNKRFLFVITILLILTGITIALFILKEGNKLATPEHTTEINRHLLRLRDNWDEVDRYDNALVEKDRDYDYCILDVDGRVIMYTRTDIAKSVSSATSNYDIIRDIEVNGRIVGRLIVDNNLIEQLDKQNIQLVLMIVITILVLILILIIYFFYLYRTLVKPFKKLNNFAVRIAAGDLETPLEMDREHVFGSFTEAFDIMREELKRSREREEAAVRSRKELVAELSHDIKTPVASIKAMSEVMNLTAKSDSERETIAAIEGKADQIDKLISNLFHATLEELEQLEVSVEELSSTELIRMFKEADHMKKISSLDIKDAVILGDMMRLDQVISNIIFNSYKYADTEIQVISEFETRDRDRYFVIEISDKGGGVPDDEIELIMEKFRRGSNASGKEGSGLGLYISNYLMEKMGGGMSCRNGEEGLIVTLRIKIA